MSSYHTTVLQPGWQSETPSQKKKYRDRTTFTMQKNHCSHSLGEGLVYAKTGNGVAKQEMIFKNKLREQQRNKKKGWIQEMANR